MSDNDMEKCPCGKPLHYQDPQKRLHTEQMIAQAGPDSVVTFEGRSWRVPRHFISLHGLEITELPELAKKYGFKPVTKDSK